MAQKNFMQRHPWVALSLINLTALVVLVGLAEVTLRVFFPMTVNVAGFVRTENGRKYGWGFDSNQMIRVDNPDTGEVYIDRVNNHGWRDVKRSFEKPVGVFRVLILGDSVTFGYIVPTELVFTRILEKRLRAEGYNVEILNMSYSGWGTHQQYEALRNEGIRYKPDLVIFNTTANDIGENQHYMLDGKFGRRVPFYYELSESGELVRQEVPEFKRELEALTRKHVISKSQILTRLWILRSVWKGRKYSGYAISDKTVFRLEECIAPLGHPEFVAELSKFEGKPISKNELEALIVKHQLNDSLKERVLQLTENRPSNRDWRKTGFYEEPKYTESGMKVFVALLKEAKKLSNSVGAKFAVSVNRGRGSFNRSVQQCSLAPGEDQFYKYMLFERLTRNFAEQNGANFVDQFVAVSGARNDSHPNGEGNIAMAENYYRYLIKNHAKELAAHRVEN